MAADKGKRSKFAEQGVGEDATDQLDRELVLSIEKLQEVQDELEKISDDASDKVFEVEKKYNEIRQPVYKKRNEIIQSIPDFWLTAFLSHPGLSQLLCEEDQKIFKYLSSLDVEDSKDFKSGYTITFNFSTNPYFEETKLSKSYTFFDDGTTNITGTTIKWKEGMGIPNGDSHEKKGKKRPLAEESFFSWFDETQVKSLSEGISDEVAELIREEVWPNPLRYFNNEAYEEDFEGDEDDEEDKGSNEDDDEQDDEDEDDDEDN